MTDIQHVADPEWPVAEAPSSVSDPSLPRPVPLYGPRFQQNPAEVYAEIRRDHGPVAPVLLDGDIPAWLVSGYREVHQVTSDPQLFARDSRRWNAWSRVPKNWPLLPYLGYNPSITFTEGPEHRRRSGAIGDALATLDQFELRSHCEQVADRLIDEFAGRGEADLMIHYAQRIPLLVIAKMYGMSEAGTPALVRDIAASAESGPDAMDAYLRVQAAMELLLEHKRGYPGPDVPTRLLQHSANISDEDLVVDLILMAVAAQLPTGNWIGNTVQLMLTDSRFAVTLSGGRRSVGQALNEVMWQDSPLQNIPGRFAARDTQLGGRRIRTGDLLVLCLAGANSDPQVHPGSSDNSGNRAHLSFGHGEHGCPYPAPEIAEIIAKTAVEVLLDRLPDVVLAVPADTLVWQPSVWIRGLTSLPVEFTPTYVTTNVTSPATFGTW